MSTRIRRGPAFRPSHPGELIATALEGLDLPLSSAAKDLGITRQTLDGIIAGRSPVTPDIAARLGKLFGNGAGLWLRMQTIHDRWQG
ncbi:HigA family addiction module antitoxin [Hansschlegelia beijingensis]|uniref:HigA family addiction module antitoxin n=1 Tax=Hansschlegelia beijingensis TaxID=1133344 RepID=UPI0037F1BB85